MPSAQQKQSEQPELATSARTEADLQSLLMEIHAAKIGNLNLVHGRGTVILAEGEPAHGVYILHTGRATVSISSSEGRVVMLRIAQAGDVLGLNSVLHNLPYDVTMKAMDSCRTDFVPRNELLEVMRQSEAGAHALLKILGHELTDLTQRVKLLLLPQTVSGRLAKLLLEWSRANGSSGSEMGRVDRNFTHEELSQMICTSRETVTRLLAHLGKARIIRMTPDSVLICNRLALEKIAAGDGRHI